MSQPRPATVHIAAVLQLFVVLLSLGAIRLAWLGEVTESSRYGAIVLTALGALVALWFGATLIPLWLGSNTARVMAAVGAGFYQLVALFFCVCGGFLAVISLPLSAEVNETPDPWQLVASGMTFVVISVLLLALLVLLLVPPSHRWYTVKGSYGG